MLSALTPRLITRVFVVVSWFFLVTLALLFCFLLLTAPYIVGLVLLFALFAVLPYPLFIWGLLLFIRYHSFLKGTLLKPRRLWLETTLLNILCLVSLVVLRSFYNAFFNSTLGWIVFLCLVFWQLIAIGLSLRAYTLSSITPADHFESS